MVGQLKLRQMKLRLAMAFKIHMLAFLTLIFSGFYLNRGTSLIPRQTGNSHDYSPQSVMRDWQNLQFNSEITHLVCTEKSDCEK